MASLKKRDGSRKPWQVRYRDHAGRDRSEQYTRKADAEARLREVQTAEETGRMDVLDSGTATLSEVGVPVLQVAQARMVEEHSAGPRLRLERDGGGRG